jgi:hypothetical protein
MKFKIEPYIGTDKLWYALYKKKSWLSNWRYVTLFTTVDKAEEFILLLKGVKDERIGKIY